MARSIALFAVAVLVAAGLHWVMWSKKEEPVKREAAPLILAVRRGDLELVKRFLDAGADPDEATGLEGFTALGTVVKRCARESEFYPEHSANWPQPATYKVNKDIIRALLDHGASIDVGSGGGSWGGSAIGDAVVSGDLQLVELLLVGRRSHAEPKLADRTPLYMLGRSAGDVHQEHRFVPDRDLSAAIVRLLVRNGVDIDHRDDEGRTALHEAARWGRLAAVQALIACGADVNVRDKNGLTALECARTVAIEEAIRKAGGKGAVRIGVSRIPSRREQPSTAGKPSHGESLACIPVGLRLSPPPLSSPATPKPAANEGKVVAGEEVPPLPTPVRQFPGAVEGSQSLVLTAMAGGKGAE